MFLSGKKLFIYKLNKVKEFIYMFATVFAAISSMMFMFVAWC